MNSASWDRKRKAVDYVMKLSKHSLLSVCGGVCLLLLSVETINCQFVQSPRCLTPPQHFFIECELQHRRVIMKKRNKHFYERKEIRKLRTEGQEKQITNSKK